MRRKDREVTDYSKMLEIMQKCDCCRLSFADEVAPYIVPLNFGFEESEGRLFLYFHSAGEGKKIDMAGKQPYVGFEMDTKHELIEGDIACDYSFLYQSIIGKGKIELIDEKTEKIAGLNAIMRHYTKSSSDEKTCAKNSWEYSESSLKAIVVMKLSVTEWSCKEH